MTDPAKAGATYLADILQHAPFEEPYALAAAHQTLRQWEHLPQDQAQNEDRDPFNHELEKVQAQFWKAPKDALADPLNRLLTSPFPDLAHKATELNNLMAQRDAFLTLDQKPKLHAPFLSAYKNILTAPPKQAAFLKDQFEKNLTHKKDIKATKKTIKAIKKQAPLLAAKHSDWLKKLLKIERERKLNKKQTISIIIIIWLVLQLIRALVKLGE